MKEVVTSASGKLSLTAPRQARTPLRIYLLIGPDGSPTGNLTEWPVNAPAPGVATDVDVLHAAKGARVRTLNFSDGIRLLVGRTLSERNNFEHIVAESLFSVLAANLLLGAAAGTVIAFYARRRLGQINATTQAVLEGNLSERIAVGDGGDEYDQIAQNINAMLDRIQRLIATIRGVTENIAHDLRTPSEPSARQAGGGADVASFGRGVPGGAEARHC